MCNVSIKTTHLSRSRSLSLSYCDCLLCLSLFWLSLYFQFPELLVEDDPPSLESELVCDEDLLFGIYGGPGVDCDGDG